MKDVIIKEKIFNHSIDIVWNAISKKEEISKWFIKTDFKAEKGYQYRFSSESNKKDCTDITGTVVEAFPYTLIYTWLVAGTNIETTITWKLESVTEGTKLYLEHSGISKYKGDTAITMFESFNGGWNGCINQLENYLKLNMNAG
ncbi:SRPBCC domain-containing protein [Xanthomarina sp. GH4-25]|uniref:SRPBCC domain-containing protein n=1 Tax=Xanthomarina sp. GH4-25 TaxID=3349335 RepID=UPI003877BE0A